MFLVVQVKLELHLSLHCHKPFHCLQMLSTMTSLPVLTGGDVFSSACASDVGSKSVFVPLMLSVLPAVSLSLPFGRRTSDVVAVTVVTRSTLIRERPMFARSHV